MQIDGCRSEMPNYSGNRTTLSLSSETYLIEDPIFVERWHESCRFVYRDRWIELHQLGFVHLQRVHRTGSVTLNDVSLYICIYIFSLLYLLTCVMNFPFGLRILKDNWSIFRKNSHNSPVGVAVIGMSVRSPKM